MKTTMDMTLDGLVRALRIRMHSLADNIEAGYRHRQGHLSREGAEKPTHRSGRGADDAIAGD